MSPASCQLSCRYCLIPNIRQNSTNSNAMKIMKTTGMMNGIKIHIGCIPGMMVSLSTDISIDTRNRIANIALPKLTKSNFIFIVHI